MYLGGFNMRVLLLLRGATGCGKSTFIDKNGLKPYTLSADEIRLQCQSAQQTIYGEDTISMDNELVTWRVLMELLEVRMQKGELTVIDAVNSKTEEMNKYKDLADAYRYRMYCVDFTGLPIEECKRRNAGREPLKRVPDEAIDKMYARFRGQKIPSGIKVLKEDELDKIWYKPIDFSKYEKVVHIGDIHGCYTALMEYFKNNSLDNEKNLYIFTGDYIDRGIENADVVKFLIEASQHNNVILLEGNHDRNLSIFAHGGSSKNKEFEFGTRRELEAANIDLKEIRCLYRRICQCAWYKYDDKYVFVNHGGVATLPDNLTKLATTQMINGVGTYDEYETVADTWMNTTKDNMYQIHGHRNPKAGPMKARDRIYTLDGGVEFGGEFRVLELTHEGFNEISIKNNVFKQLEDTTGSFGEDENAENISDVILELRADKRKIEEKNFGHISSFNFTRDLFFDKDGWNNQNIKARGLYIDIDKFKVAARSFDKFFNVNEMPFTRFGMLKYKLQFPVTAYVKENGFLGIVAYDEYGDYEDNLLVTTKSSIDGDYAVWIRNMLNKKTTKETRDAMAEYCRDNDCSLVFECVDMENDPHIIEYPESDLFLLACVKNELKYNQLSYNDLCLLAKRFNIRVKEEAFVLNDWNEFFDWYNEVTSADYMYHDRHIEGFVIEDSVGFMTKIKLSYYQFWKHMRAVAREALNHGYIRRTGSLTDALSNDFYKFCRDLYNSAETPEERAEIPRDVISLRNMFYKSYNENSKV